MDQDMGLRPDGRKYAKVTRRSKAILECLPDVGPLAVSEAVEQIFKIRRQDFYLSRYDRTISPARLRVYLRFLKQLGMVSIGESQIERTFRLPSSDDRWAQSLADRARNDLAIRLNRKPGEIPGLLRS